MAARGEAGQPVRIGHLPQEFRDRARGVLPPPDLTDPGTAALFASLRPVVAPAFQKITEEQAAQRQEEGAA